MEWTLRLVGAGIDGQSRSFEVMAISRPEGLGDIAALGLTLAEAKQLLVQVQQEVVAAQARQRTLFRPDCQSCSGRCHVKDWRPHRMATLFREVRLRLPRFLCPGSRCDETDGSWPSHCRPTSPSSLTTNWRPRLGVRQTRSSGAVQRRRSSGEARQIRAISNIQGPQPRKLSSSGATMPIDPTPEVPTGGRPGRSSAVAGRQSAHT